MNPQIDNFEIIIDSWFKLIERIFILGSLIYICRSLKDLMLYVFIAIFLISFWLLAIQSTFVINQLVKTFDIKVKDKQTFIVVVFSIVEIILLGAAIYIAFNLPKIPNL